MDIETQSILNIVLFTFGLSLIAVYIAANNLAIRKISFWTGIAFLLLFGVGSIAASQRNHYLTEHHEAIVFSQTVNIKSSPDENSKDIFVLHEGIKVTLLDVVAEWQEIRIANGSVGWIKTVDIKKI
jgi:arginine exporter protein ArgO